MKALCNSLPQCWISASLLPHGIEMRLLTPFMHIAEPWEHRSFADCQRRCSTLVCVTPLQQMPSLLRCWSTLCTSSSQTSTISGANQYSQCGQSCNLLTTHWVHDTTTPQHAQIIIGVHKHASLHKKQAQWYFHARSSMRFHMQSSCKEHGAGWWMRSSIASPGCAQLSALCAAYACILDG